MSYWNEKSLTILLSFIFHINLYKKNEELIL